MFPGFFVLSDAQNLMFPRPKVADWLGMIINGLDIK